VAEWTADTRSASRVGCWRSFTNPLCLDGVSSERYVRGGSYFTTDDPSMRSASRLAIPASTSTSHVGFRCARSP
jgi:formylglycine-generating enzyme required for sulfatase activity